MRHLLIIGIAATALIMATDAAGASKGRILHEFTNGADGGFAYGPLVLDAAGNLYGTTQTGGQSSAGTVFELSATNNVWTETVLYSFTGGSDGASPYGGLTRDATGNLFGMTNSGGSGCGVVFELENDTGGWVEKTIHTFGNQQDGCNPLYSSLIFDSSGNLYGVTYEGGLLNQGVVFELQPQSGGDWNFVLIHAFGGNLLDGGYPNCTLVMDSTGTLYGTTSGSGVYGAGTVFKVEFLNGEWIESTIYSFTGGDNGSYPQAGVIFDARGNLYGTTLSGGIDDVGTVFRLTPTKGIWKIHTIHNFAAGGDGAKPYSGLVMDRRGNLYGTTAFGGFFEYGTVFQLTPSSNADWSETIIHSFSNGRDGSIPQIAPTLDSLGNLYGTTIEGGNYGVGVVYEFKQ